MINLMQGDCLELMKEIPDGSVDMILCDLPYGTTDCAWDSVIPVSPLWEQYNRIIKPNGAICLFGSEPFSSALRISNIKHFKYDWIWRKNRPSGFQHAKNAPMKNHEIISIFSNGSMGHKSLLGDKRMIYNPQGINFCGKYTKASKNRFGNIVGKRPSHKEITFQEYTGYPKSVLDFDVSEEHFHPTQKPVPLLEYLIRTYTTEGETVLDNCMGSGSTGVACINTNRNFIGMELDQQYFEIAKKRIAESTSRHTAGRK